MTTELFEVRRVVPGLEGTLKVSAMSIMVNARALADSTTASIAAGSLTVVDQPLQMLLSMIECDNVNDGRVITNNSLRQEIMTTLQAALAYFQQSQADPAQYHELEILLGIFIEPR